MFFEKEMWAMFLLVLLTEVPHGQIEMAKFFRENCVKGLYVETPCPMISGLNADFEPLFTHFSMNHLWKLFRNTREKLFWDKKARSEKDGKN